MGKNEKRYFEEGTLGLFSKGEKNSITDVKGVKVGHLTVHKEIEASGKKASIRTGLTAVLPYAMEKEMRLFCGSYNPWGKAEITGYEVFDDFCYINSPVVITNLFNVGKVYNAILSFGFALNRDEIWPPVVIGIDDSYLNDMTKYLFDEKEILEAFFKATDGKPEEGSVGAGLGLRAFGWKGGVGTSSRLLSLGGESFACGVLAATNHANRSSKESNQFAESLKDQEGSLAIVLATDIPLLPHQIKQILHLFMANLAPLQSWDKSQDSVSTVLFSTANAMSMVDRGPLVFDFRAIDDSFLGRITQAFSEAVQEAIFRSLLEATAIEGRLRRKIGKIPHQEFLELQKNFGG